MLNYSRCLSFEEKVFVMAGMHKASQDKIEDENEYKHTVDLPQTTFTLRAIQQHVNQKYKSYEMRNIY